MKSCFHLFYCSRYDNDAVRLHIRIYTWSNKFTKSQEKSKHLTYMDDINVYAKNDGEQETLIQIIRIFSQDIVK